jgi:hypothetical protein
VPLTRKPCWLPAATSTLDELTRGTFQRVLGDPEVAASKARRALLCSGKIFYELVEERKKRGDDHTMIVRLEQLYPFRADHVTAALRYHQEFSRLRPDVMVVEQHRLLGHAADGVVLVQLVVILAHPDIGQHVMGICDGHRIGADVAPDHIAHLTEGVAIDVLEEGQRLVASGSPDRRIGGLATERVGGHFNAA